MPHSSRYQTPVICKQQEKRWVKITTLAHNWGDDLPSSTWSMSQKGVTALLQTPVQCQMHSIDTVWQHVLYIYCLKQDRCYQRRRCSLCTLSRIYVLLLQEARFSNFICLHIEKNISRSNRKVSPAILQSKQKIQNNPIAFKFKTMLLTRKAASLETHNHQEDYFSLTAPFCTKTHKTTYLGNWQRKSEVQGRITAMVNTDVNWMQTKKRGLLLHYSDQTS